MFSPPSASLFKITCQRERKASFGLNRPKSDGSNRASIRRNAWLPRPEGIRVEDTMSDFMVCLCRRLRDRNTAFRPQLQRRRKGLSVEVVRACATGFRERAKQFAILFRVESDLLNPSVVEIAGFPSIAEPSPLPLLFLARFGLVRFAD